MPTREEIAVVKAPTELALPAPEPLPSPKPPSRMTPVRRARRFSIIDRLRRPQTVTEIIVGTALNRNTCEQAIFRAVKAEQIEKVAPGT